jgi:RNA polymerase sigma-70 factor (ECF subfamily)
MDKEKASKNQRLLADESIIKLYWERDERAIVETDRKYKGYLHTIAYNILHDRLDCEECLNDTYLGTWNAIPPERPSIFQAFLSKIMRNTAIVRYKRNSASKRIPSEMTVSLEELGESMPQSPSAEDEYLTSQVSRIVSDFLRSLPERSAFIFICRYYCSDRIADIAAMLALSERTVFRELTAMRDELKELLIKEGYYNA